MSAASPVFNSRLDALTIKCEIVSMAHRDVLDVKHYDRYLVNSFLPRQWIWDWRFLDILGLLLLLRFLLVLLMWLILLGFLIDRIGFLF